MSNQISIYDPRIMLASISSVMPTQTFFKGTFFNNENTFTTETVDVDYYKGRRKAAPFVSPLLPGKAMDRAGFTTKSFKPASIKPLRVITGENLNKRSMGENIYSAKTPEQRAQEMLAQDLIDLDDAITRREEMMISQLLFTGEVHMIGDGVDQVLDFDFTNKQTLSGTDLWSDPNSDPIAFLKNKRLTVIQKSGVNPDMVVMASDVVDAFVNHPKVQKVLDNQRIVLGKIEPQTFPNGVTYIGSISSLGLDIYSYDEWYFDEDTQTEKPMVPEGTIMVASKRAKSSMLYGAVTLADPKTNSFRTFEGSRIPNSWVQMDPAARYLQIHSRPLPVPHEVDSWYVAKVL